MHVGFQPALGHPSQSCHMHVNIYIYISMTHSAAGKSVVRVIATRSNNFFTLGAENLFQLLSLR